MMEAIASMASSMSAAQIASSYSTAMTKKSMETTEMIAEQLLEMLPQAPAKGQYIDVYA